MPEQPKMIMAFDFGTQKMGIAVGQQAIASVNPLPLFPMKDGIPQWDQLLKIVKTWQPDIFLVGLPLNMDDTESDLSLRARKFARRLRHQTNIETWMVDERLTTREAREDLAHYQQQGRGKSIAADSLAASLFIESWYHTPYGVKP
ncbi:MULTISPECIES: Holliday junction resolvase RuvX [Acinetobacter]|jgi:putative holliday junction resolvase|uniref:Putative pre-16S rRNA nuclease n=1 Tax=Acinetobacter pollinis TaxID=2605270 RepID=A0ABU6DSN4_9GAMM|nr:MULTISPECIES: Holliday junction resolvase RuvX [Acinetobacter]MBF7691022.1 Holliday junction resolvase RuvX [Acinetobacter pollinis]MBF7692316.1 Holliday junction resolvase RuvX [Acinetobacter pollinis]MBF7697075.1 Holliday junction resolvase RuvX [Acinetobacter pollinis]MBF7700127.1 Holliday junction resolvase RuvX [Acinetobacter pollinis]MEB5476710.1 Holliday junction resolvase RuvX [Acinetobacter pollinis]